MSHTICNGEVPLTIVEVKGRRPHGAPPGTPAPVRQQVRPVFDGWEHLCRVVPGGVDALWKTVLEEIVFPAAAEATKNSVDEAGNLNPVKYEQEFLTSLGVRDRASKRDLQEKISELSRDLCELIVGLNPEELNSPAGKEKMHQVLRLQMEIKQLQQQLTSRKRVGIAKS